MQWCNQRIFIRNRTQRSTFQAEGRDLVEAKILTHGWDVVQIRTGKTYHGVDSPGYIVSGALEMASERNQTDQMTLDHTSTNGVYGLLTSLKGQQEETIFKKEKLLSRHGDTHIISQERQADFCAFEAGMEFQDDNGYIERPCLKRVEKVLTPCTHRKIWK